ncbi:ParA family protein [Chondrinema litorale]|uniref:ParA family protein n=1 Tax=Chondrinema litorale TaxID=2994555 RepID=UPI002543E4A6|nr:ParA family protein [Chondrinema litorale]UZR97815.1 ParA family protein [Chondrinema litorale]
MAEIVSILNLKGGVGKTTTAINLGKALSRLKKKVLVIDNDSQANLTHGLGFTDFSKSVYHTYKDKESLPILQEDEFFHIVPSQLALASIESEVESDINRYYILADAIESVKKKYDFVLIDCPPSLGVYTINAITTSTKFLITTQTDRFSIDGLLEVYRFINNKIKKRLNSNIELMGVLITLFIQNTVATDIGLEELEKHFPGKILHTRIRHTTKFKESTIAGEDIFTYDPKGKGAHDYENLALEILKKNG